jgi:hypothetical protein
MARIADRLRRRHPNVGVRPMDIRRFREEILRFMPVFEEARSGNWGYVPITERELTELADELRLIIDPEIVIVAEVDGEPAGVSLGIPDINQPLAAAGGRLFPFGWIGFMRRRKRLTHIRVFGVATLKKYRMLGITNLLLLETVLRGIARGYRSAEASWVLEDNVLSTRTIGSALDPVHYKTYRIYEKPIGGRGR